MSTPSHFWRNTLAIATGITLLFTVIAAIDVETGQQAVASEVDRWLDLISVIYLIVAAATNSPVAGFIATFITFGLFFFPVTAIIAGIIFLALRVKAKKQYRTS